ncbi:uncharacterized protein LOC144104978 [Amblyomma americanum]
MRMAQQRRDAALAGTSNVQASQDEDSQTSDNESAARQLLVTLCEPECRQPCSPDSPQSQQSEQDATAENIAAVHIESGIVPSAQVEEQQPQRKRPCRRNVTTGVRSLQAMGLELLARREDYEFRLMQEELALGRQRLALEERKLALEEERHRLEVQRHAEQHDHVLARLDRLERLLEKKNT